MKIERLDDLPLLGAALKNLATCEFLDKHFVAHGNWRGISLGQLCSVFLLYILSESDHRLSHLQEWAKERELGLRHILGCPNFTHLDCTDDRLAILLDYLSDDETYLKFEAEFNRHTLCVYSLLPVEEDLSANVVHLDATIAQSFRAAKGLFAAGYSKHRRADLPQIKIMLSTFSPFGIPLCVEVVKGSSADDELYLPMIARVEQTLMKQGLLFVGDSKLGSILNRYTVHLGKNYYLTPLNRVQLPFAELQRLLVENKDKASVLNEEDAVKITAFEITQQRAQELTTWEERVIIAYSAPYNQTQTAKFDKQLNKTEAALKELAVSKQGKTQLKTVEEVQNKVDEIFKENKTTEFFDLIITPQLTEKTTRKYKDIPARTTTTTHFSLTITRKKDKIAEYKAVLGWRAYATNAPIDKLSTLKVLQTYKDEFKVEYRFNQLHNKTAPLMPIFLHKENRITALVRLLMLAIKVLGLLEYKIRKQIDLENIQINHIYPGNPARKTNKPTAEMVLRAFRNIFLAATPTDNNNFSLQVTQLLPHQQILIRLAGFQNLIYNDISSQPNFNKNCISYNSEDAIKGKSFITSRIDSSE